MGKSTVLHVQFFNSKVVVYQRVTALVFLIIASATNKGGRMVLITLRIIPLQVLLRNHGYNHSCTVSILYPTYKWDDTGNQEFTELDSEPLNLNEDDPRTK